MCIDVHGILLYLYVDRTKKISTLGFTLYSLLYSYSALAANILSSITIIFLGVNEDDDDWFDLCRSVSFNDHFHPSIIYNISCVAYFVINQIIEYNTFLKRIF